MPISAMTTMGETVSPAKGPLVSCVTVPKAPFCSAMPTLPASSASVPVNVAPTSAIRNGAPTAMQAMNEIIVADSKQQPGIFLMKNTPA